MEPIVEKRQADSAPIPVIGIEPALESANRELANKELAITGMDSSEIGGDDKLSRIAVLAIIKQRRGVMSLGMRCKTGWMPKLKLWKKLKGRKLNECSV